MKVLGLTGGIGMGRSTCAELVRARGISVVDTDDLAREVVAGQPALVEVRDAFGLEVLDGQGRLRRRELAGRVFSDPRARKRLEAILHPRIRQLWLERVRQWATEGCRCACVVIPLLFETSAEGTFDAIICLACSVETQKQRLYQRGWSDVDIAQRLATCTC